MFEVQGGRAWPQTRRPTTQARHPLTTLAEQMMNGTPRKRLVTLMAAAAGVTAGLGAMAAPAQAHTAAPTTLAADTLIKSKPAATKAKATTAPAKGAAAAKAKSATTTKAAAAKPAAPAKAVVSTGPNAPSPNDACGDEADCRNANGAGY